MAYYECATFPALQASTASGCMLSMAHCVVKACSSSRLEVRPPPRFPLTSIRMGSTRKIRNWSPTTSSTFAGNTFCMRNRNKSTTIENHCQRERRRRSMRMEFPLVLLACIGERARRQVIPSKAVTSASTKVSLSTVAIPVEKVGYVRSNFTNLFPEHRRCTELDWQVRDPQFSSARNRCESRETVQMAQHCAYK